MKAPGLVVSDKKIFENCIIKTYFLTPWPTYTTNQNHFRNFGREPPRDHFCEVWSKSSERFQRRRCLCKTVDGRRRTTTDDGQKSVTIAYTEYFVLKYEDNQPELRFSGYMGLMVKWKPIQNAVMAKFCSTDGCKKHNISNNKEHRQYVSIILEY